MPDPNHRCISRREFMRLAIAGAAVGLIGAASASCYAVEFEPRWIEVVHLRVPLARLPGRFVGLTIAQISDLHLGRLVKEELISQAVDTVLGLKPDVIVITGDFVSRIGVKEKEQIARQLTRLSAPMGVFAVLGNHDYWADREAVTEAITNARITLLINDGVKLNKEEEGLHIVGVDDALAGQANAHEALRSVPAEGCAILLAHEPDFADIAARDPRVALQLSGHSHGGQVRIPLRGPVLLPHLAHKYPQGLWQLENMMLYVNRGIGMSYLPIRLNCRPEVTLLELTQAEPADTSNVTGSQFGNT